MNTLHTINSTVAQLQQAIATLPPEQQAPLQNVLTQLSTQCQQLRDHVADGLYSLTENDSGLQGLMALLELAEAHAIPAYQIAGLLAPLQQQVRDTVATLCDVL